MTVHQGCGLTNAITGITEAAKSRTPLLVLAADVAGSAVRSNFRIEQEALARSVGAVPERVHSAASALADVTRAWRTARNGRRTVVLNLPLDVQAMGVPDETPDFVRDPGRPAAVQPGDRDVRRLVEFMRAAERPVFLGGRGARACGPGLRKLAEQSGALLATSAERLMASS